MIKNHKIDELVWQSAFGTKEEKSKASLALKDIAYKNLIQLASINDLYLARGKGKVPFNFTVPAINLRGITYEMARSIFKIAKAKKVAAFILEIARSEMEYTDQKPQEFVSVILGAAIKEGFRGPLFIQGDHFQVKAANPGQPKKGELTKVKQLIRETIDAGFYNIDLDTSTLVDLSKKTVFEQQQPNFFYASQLANFVRSMESSGITVSLGGEIGEIGGKNSTEEELRAYLKGFRQNISVDTIGLSKISIQTGTHHGGIVLADGTLAKVDVDFQTLKKLSAVAREHGMAGAVQHGASTLPEAYFSEFPRSQAIEVHLATEFQNIIMDNPAFPKILLEKMYSWLDNEMIQEKEPNQTPRQFHYKLRKKAWGKFKKEAWSIPKESLEKIKPKLEDKLAFLFKELEVENTQELVSKYIK